MNPIGVGSTSDYKSPYGKEALRAKTGYNPALNAEGEKDTYLSKTKSEKKDKKIGLLATIGLMVASGFAAYKGKAKIQTGLTALKQRSGEWVGKLKTKWPNLSQAGSSLKEACKTPLGVLKKAFGNLTGFFKNIGKK